MPIASPTRTAHGIKCRVTLARPELPLRARFAFQARRSPKGRDSVMARLPIVVIAEIGRWQLRHAVHESYKQNRLVWQPSARRLISVFRCYNRTWSRPVFFIVFHCSSHCFSIDIHCSCARGVSLVFAKIYIADGVDFPLQIDCIFFSRLFCENPLGLPRFFGPRLA
jgi:hypothetical protein